MLSRNWRVQLGPMRVTDKRLTHFLFPVTFLTLCGFRGGNENLFEIVASALFVLASSFPCCSLRDFSRLPQLKSLLAGYVLASQFVDFSYT